MAIASPLSYAAARVPVDQREEAARQMLVQPGAEPIAPNQGFDQSVQQAAPTMADSYAAARAQTAAADQMRRNPQQPEVTQPGAGFEQQLSADVANAHPFVESYAAARAPAQMPAPAHYTPTPDFTSGAPGPAGEYAYQGNVPTDQAAFTPPPEAEHHQGDFTVKDRLMHALKGMGIGFLRGGVGGAVAGGIGSAVNKDFFHNLQHAQQVQNWEQQHNAEESYAAARMKQRQEAAGLTGIDPTTGLPTEAARSRRVQQDYNLLRQSELNDDRTRRYDESKRQHDLTEEGRRRRELGAAYRAGLLIKPEQRTEYAKSLGLSGDLAEPFIRGLIDVQVDANGELISVNRRDATAAPVTDANGNHVTSFKATQEKDKMTRTQALINAGVNRQAAELQVRKEIEAAREGAASARQERDLSAGKYKKKGGGLFDGPAPTTDHTGYTAGKSTIEQGGKRYIYRGLNPSSGKMIWEEVP